MKEITTDALTDNVFTTIGKEWMLISVKKGETVNAMTASWGGLGFLWNRPVAFVFIRPERFTHELVESEERMTLSFLGQGKHREAYRLLGTLSGRDTDKMKQSGLTLTETPDGQPTFSEARLVLEGRKLYKSPFKAEDFIDKDCLTTWYNEKPGGGLHDMYIVEIEHVYTAE